MPSIKPKLNSVIPAFRIEGRTKNICQLVADLEDRDQQEIYRRALRLLANDFETKNPGCLEADLGNKKIK